MQGTRANSQTEAFVAVTVPIERVADFIGSRGIRRVAADIRAVYPAFSSTRFTRIASTGIDDLTLFGRANQVAGVLHEVLAMPFSKMVPLLVEASGPARRDPGYGPMENFRFLAFTRLISLHGLEYFADSMWGLKRLTSRFTAEFDLRPFLLTAEAATLRELQAWVKEDDFHVRRLVSEGTRTRLPWGIHLKSFQRDPSKILALIEQLNSDPAKYVQISVANNLADIIKDDAAIGLAIAEKWVAAGHPITRKIVHHAVRYPAMRGCARSTALRLK